jgi:hypothetical protein
MIIQDSFTVYSGTYIHGFGDATVICTKIETDSSARTEYFAFLVENLDNFLHDEHFIECQKQNSHNKGIKIDIKDLFNQIKLDAETRLSQQIKQRCQDFEINKFNNLFTLSPVDDGVIREIIMGNNFRQYIKHIIGTTKSEKLRMFLEYNLKILPNAKLRT